MPRRSQKVFKPEFFNSLQKEKDARDAVTITREWIAREDLKVVGALSLLLSSDLYSSLSGSRTRQLNVLADGVGLT